MFSPNLAIVAAEMRARFHATGGSGYVVRAVRAGTAPSSHGFGAAWDGTFASDSDRAAAMDWLLTNSELLGVQAVHHYIGSRLWRVGIGWKPVTPNAAEGWGQSWAKWLHIETPPDRWHDDRPLASRGSMPLAAVLAPAVPGKVSVFAQPTIQAGTPRSLNVSALQRGLSEAGIDVGLPDGLCGPRTVEGIKELQRRLGFRGRLVDGIYGPQTYARWVATG